VLQEFREDGIDKIKVFVTAVLKVLYKVILTFDRIGTQTHISGYSRQQRGKVFQQGDYGFRE